jgi:hypothetical protein
MSGGKTAVQCSRNIIILTLLLSIILAVSFSCNTTDEPLSFIIAQDQRYKATEKYHKPEFFMGALLAIEKVGKGAFMISPGDIDPMEATRNLVAEILGEDYPWYPAVGNHDIEDPANIEYFREYNHSGNSLSNVVRIGPPGCEETTYSFEVGNCHIAIINVYFDGKSDHGTDGDIVPELLDWLEEDLKNTDKPFVFVAGHEPLLAQPDMDNGRIRHQGDSLDKYYRNAYKLRELLKKYNVRAVFNGHTHGASICKINGLWQVDSGHAYGIENPFPEFLFQELTDYIESESKSGRTTQEIIAEYFSQDSYDIKKVLYYSGISNGVHYKQLSDEYGLLYLIEFYENSRDNLEVRQKYIDTFYGNYDLSRSTFIKVTLEDPVKVDVYRDDARGGEYTLMHTVYLN